MSIPAFLPLCRCASCTEERIRVIVEAYWIDFRLNGFASKLDGGAEHDEAWRRFREQFHG